MTQADVPHATVVCRNVEGTSKDAATLDMGIAASTIAG
jgi:hypothetical protein